MFLHIDDLDTPEEIINEAYICYGPKLLASTSWGRNAAVLLKMIEESGFGIRIIHMDPGNVPPENSAYKEQLLSRLNIDVATYRSPSLSDEEKNELSLLQNGNEAEREKLEQFYNDRKLRLFAEAVSELGPKAMLFGARAAQNAFRRTLNVCEKREDGLIDLYPLLHMSNEDALKYLQRHGLPLHPDGPPSEKKKRECRLHTGCGARTAHIVEVTRRRSG